MQNKATRENDKEPQVQNEEEERRNAGAREG